MSTVPLSVLSEVESVAAAASEAGSGDLPRGHAEGPGDEVEFDAAWRAAEMSAAVEIAERTARNSVAPSPTTHAILTVLKALEA